MRFQPLDAEKSGLYSKLVLDYLAKKKELEPFISNWPTREGFHKQIQERANFPVDRENLVKALRRQYSGLEPGTPLEINLKRLEDLNTYTVTTGQQIHVFLGPMYVYWKIVSTIALARKLKQEFPENHFVPVFWMATEDHDFAEIDHLELFSRSFKWNHDRSVPGPVGRLSTEGLPELSEQILALFLREENFKKYEALFQEAYTRFGNFADATRFLVHSLFGEYGLVIIDPDDEALKKDLLPIVKDELLFEKSKERVEETSEALAKTYSLQIHPREINLFYVSKAGRERLIKREGRIETLNGEILGDIAALDSWLPQKIKDISTNVVLRPVYQECILPNLAYIGGPGETAYWLQLKEVFTHFSLLFPILENRKSVFVIGEKIKAGIEKFRLQAEDLFLEEDELRKKAMERSDDGLVSLKEELEEWELLKDKMIKKAASINPAQARPIAEIFNQNEKIIRKIEKEIFTLQEAGLEKGLEKVFKIKALIKEKGFTQERDQYLVQYLFQLDTKGIIDLLTMNYEECGPVALLVE
ncbi:MAG: bacillithiol biosynthesis cysteine-adding enzyme BshC [Bacteroidia bacterium]